MQTIHNTGQTYSKMADTLTQHTFTLQNKCFPVTPDSKAAAQEHVNVQPL